MEAKTDSAWIGEFQKQLIRGKHVLLYGNIADQFLFQGNYCSLTGFLNAYLVGLGYKIVTTYDIVDGFQFAQHEMQPLFEKIVWSTQSQHTGTRETARPAEAPSNHFPTANARAAEHSPASDGTGRELPGNSAGPPPRGEPSWESGPPSQLPAGAPPRARGSHSTPLPSSMAQSLRDPQQALAAIRTAIRQSEIGTAVVAVFSDKLVAGPDHHDLQERMNLIQLKKILEEAAYLSAGKLAGRKNLLVVVASQLGAVPEWLHKDNPFLELVKVPLPSQSERMVFVRDFKSNFFHDDSIDTSEIEPLVEDFANLTDGLTAWDLEAIRRTSVAERLPIHKPRELVDFYKYGIGKDDDPWAKLSQERVRNARSILEKRVIGQPDALRAIESMLVSARVGVSMATPSPIGGRPKGVFFFVGPTGVGKTELAKALTELIFSDESAFARFDMSEYAEQHAAEKLAGPPPGFVGYEEGGQLTNRVRDKPFSLLLFDEIEKAHKGVMDKFLQILEDGRLTDGKGQTAYFSHSLIIFTSNIGSDKLVVRKPGESQLTSYTEIRDHYMNAVSEHFIQKIGRPELLNRLGGNFLVFDILRPEHIPGIFRKFMDMLDASVQARLNIKLVINDDSLQSLIVSEMSSGDNLLYGGRRIKTKLEELVERPLNRWLFLQESPVDRIELTANPITRSVLINGKSVD